MPASLLDAAIFLPRYCLAAAPIKLLEQTYPVLAAPDMLWVCFI